MPRAVFQSTWLKVLWLLVDSELSALTQLAPGPANTQAPPSRWSYDSVVESDSESGSSAEKDRSCQMPISARRVMRSLVRL